MKNTVHEISKTTAARLLEYFAGRKNEMITRLRTLVETESPSGDMSGSRAVVSHLVAAAQEIKCVDSIERFESPEYGEHLLIRAFTGSNNGSGTILLVGHTDTVHAIGSLQERPWRIEGNRIYAPGVFDMKAGCVMAMEALRACEQLEVQPHREVVLLLTCDEETGSTTGRTHIEAEALRAAYALVLEPPASGGRVKTGRKGTGLFTMKVTGRAAHAGLEPEKGASAILELARQIVRLHAMNDPANGINVNVGVISGGTRPNVVAESASAEIDLRFATMDDARRMEDEIRHSVPFDDRVTIDVGGGINRPPLERNKKVLALYDRAMSIAAALDFELGEAQVGGASDGNFVAALGVPVLDGLGVDGDGAHAKHEHILSDNIVPRSALLTGLLMSL